MITTWLEAFENNIKYKKGNYRVLIDDENNTCLYLFDNLIAKQIDGNKLIITTSNYNTITTIKALNILIKDLPIKITNIKGKLTINKVYWNGDWVSINSVMNLYDTK